MIINQFANLTDSELEMCYNQFLAWNNTGFLKDGILREIADLYMENNPASSVVCINELLMEIAKRHYMK